MPVLDASTGLAIVESNLEFDVATCEETGRGRPTGAPRTPLQRPSLCALGTLKTRRDEQLPASTRYLQIPDLVVECGCVEGDPVPGIFHSSFVVPQRFILIGPCCKRTVNRLVRGAAQRNVQRVVDASKTEALRDLHVDAEAAVRLPTDDPRGEKPFDFVLSPRRGSPLANRPPEMKSRVSLKSYQRPPPVTLIWPNL